MIFIKLFVITLAASLLAFALIDGADIMFLLKAIALGAGASILVAMFYPEIRGVHKGDQVSVVTNSVIPAIFGKGGTAMSDGRVNGQVRIRLENGREAVGVLESYDGMLSLPRVRLLYEEKLVE